MISQDISYLYQILVLDNNYNNKTTTATTITPSPKLQESYYSIAYQLLSSNRTIYDTIAFKRIFNAYADNVYYSDPDRANLYLGGGGTSHLIYMFWFWFSVCFVLFWRMPLTYIPHHLTFFCLCVCVCVVLLIFPTRQNKNHSHSQIDTKFGLSITERNLGQFGQFKSRIAISIAIIIIINNNNNHG
jgi:hypothetical protein